MTSTPRDPVAEPALVDQVVASLLELVDEHKYAQALADTVMTPVKTNLDAAKVMAFRDPRLINRSVVAANFLIARVNSDMKHRVGEDASNAELARRTEAYRAMIGRERQILKAILAGLKAQRGILDSSPNPRARTKERVYQLLLAGKTVTPDRARQILDEEEEKVRTARRRAKQAAKDAAREARAQADRPGESSRSFTAQDVAVARARTGEDARRPTRRGARASR
jgi:hypothetical protein